MDGDTAFVVWPRLDGEDARRRVAVESLLQAAGFTTTFRARLLKGGRNNRVFQLHADDDNLLLKMSFRHPDDSRDRMAAEFAFSEFAWSQNVQALPRPLACAPEASVALYEYVAGRALTPGDVDERAVSEALDFYEAINRGRHWSEARALPNASEACFDLLEHVECVDRRIGRLLEQPIAPVSGPFERFVRDRLLPVWQEVRERTRTEAAASHLLAPLPEADRRLSPSDFGFHNAIKTSDGALTFFDFEYAGWDDPVKLVCDFFCQPALPVPMKYFTSVAFRVTSPLSEPELQLRRVRLLFPVYQIKWCCILLNEFVGVGRARRRFAAGAVSDRSRQLEKASRWLDRLVSPAELEDNDRDG